MSATVPYRQVEGWLFDLSEWKMRFETLNAQLAHIPGLTQQFEQFNIHGKGQKNEAVLNEVIRRLQLQDLEIPLLQLRIQLLETSIRSLLPEEQRLVVLKYRQRKPNMYVMEQLEIAHRTYYRRRKLILKKIYRMVGGAHSILSLTDEMVALNGHHTDTFTAINDQSGDDDSGTQNVVKS